MCYKKKFTELRFSKLFLRQCENVVYNRSNRMLIFADLADF